MAYETNRFCWHGINTTDPEKAAAFYPEVLGWKTVEMSMGGESAMMFAANDVPLAHFMKPPMEGLPSHWNNYLRVDDVDASTQAAVKNGGKQVVEPTDIPVGRFSVVTSPSGAAVSLFHEVDEATAEHHPGGVGSVHWTELHSGDIGADLKWLKATFGYETEEMPIPNGTYYILNSGGEPRGGAMASFMEGAPPMWLSWVRVESVDDAVKRVEQNGGKVFSPPMDMPEVGRMSVIADSTGAVFGVIEPTTPDSQ